MGTCHDVTFAIINVQWQMTTCAHVSTVSTMLSPAHVSFSENTMPSCSEQTIQDVHSSLYFGSTPIDIFTWTCFRSHAYFGMFILKCLLWRALSTDMFILTCLC
jgi:hypothetical protein